MHEMENVKFSVLRLILH